MASDPENGNATPFNRADQAFRKAGSRAAENGHQISMKMIEQAERNTREVFSAMRQMAQASSIGDVVRIQSDYVREQGERAVEHIKEVGELIAQFGRGAFSDTPDDTKKD